MLFTINGADVSVSVVRRTADLTGDTAQIAAVYRAFLDLHALVPLTRLTMTGNAVTTTCVVTRQDGGTWTQHVTMDTTTLDPFLAQTYDATWRFHQVVRSRSLADALVALVLTAKVGTLTLEP